MAQKPEAVQARNTLLAIVTADSFGQKFRPITLQRPAVLQPVLNIPLIEYTLEWLACNQVDEVIVFCCAHAKKITDYLESSKWSENGEPMKVTPIVAPPLSSFGDAMRFLDQSDIVKNDFILVSGDTVTNLSLAPVLAEHNKRRQKDKNALMTMVTTPDITPEQKVRLGEADSVFVVDPQTHRLVGYTEQNNLGSTTRIDATLFGDRDAVQVRNDLISAQIFICAPAVLVLFSDNFDYQNIRRDFLNGVLCEEDLGNKIYIHEIPGEYAVRVQSLRAYDAVSRDLLQRWAYPFTPDCQILGGGLDSPTHYKYSRGSRYIDITARKKKTSVIGNNVCIGGLTTIGGNCLIRQSVIGRNCRIDDGAQIIGSYIEDDVHVGRDVHMYHSLICKGGVVHEQAQLCKGVLLSFDVVVGPFKKIPEYSLVTLCPQPDQEDKGSSEELEYSPMATDYFPVAQTLDYYQGPTSTILYAANQLKVQKSLKDRPKYFDDSLVGPTGAGRGWVQPDTWDEQMLSIAPPVKGMEDSHIFETPTSSEVDAKSDEPRKLLLDSHFEREVAETFLRCVKMDFDQDNVKLELNGLKIAEVKTFADCARYVFTTLLFLCMPPLHHVAKDFQSLFPETAADLSIPSGQREFLKILHPLIKKWSPLMHQFLMDEDDQVELLFTIEEFHKKEGAFDIEGHWGPQIGPIVPNLCQMLYDEDLVSEDAFLLWAREKEGAQVEDLEFLKMATPFITWLKEAEEESEGDTEDSD